MIYMANGNSIKRNNNLSQRLAVGKKFMHRRIHSSNIILAIIVAAKSQASPKNRKKRQLRVTEFFSSPNKCCMLFETEIWSRNFLRCTLDFGKLQNIPQNSCYLGSLKTGSNRPQVPMKVIIVVTAILGYVSKK